MFEQSLYEPDPVAKPLNEGDPLYNYEIKGWDVNNGFHNVTFDNLTIAGTLVTPANSSNYFDVNSYVWGLNFTGP